MNRLAVGPKTTLLGLGFILLTGSLLAQEAEDSERGVFDQAAVAKDDAPPEQDGVQAQAMGLVHEAFASPTVFSAQAGSSVPKEPPQPIEEMPPEQKPDGDNIQWISGYFAFDEQKKDFYWVSGIWRNIPPSMEWVPGAWNRTTEGWQYYSGFWGRSGETELQVVPPPPEPLQTADPPAPGGDSTYVPGTWVYRDTRYVWRPACWVGYRPGWVWVPARYILTHCGWVFVEGYWDYVLRDRGILYCPVRISAAFYSRPGWVYRPAFVVHDQCLLSCMFVNRRTGCYAFGDYYGDYYRRAGYVSWVSFRVNQRPEPLLSHYRYVNRRDPRWEANLAALQADRYRGVAPRPQVTLVQQTTIIKNNRAQINNLALIAPAAKIDKTVVPLTTLNAAQWQKQAEAAKQMREASQFRAKKEAGLAKTVGAVKVGDPAKALALNLPTTTKPTVLTAKIKNLPPPPTGQRAQLSTGVGTATGEKGVATKGKGPAIDKGASTTKEKGTVTLPKDKGTVTPPKDKGMSPKDKVPPKGQGVTTDAERVSPPKVTSPTQDKPAPKVKGVVPDKTPLSTPKDKVIPPKDKAPLPKDKDPGKGAATPL